MRFRLNTLMFGLLLIQSLVFSAPQAARNPTGNKANLSAQVKKTPAEILAENGAAIAIVETDDGFGTGFFVSDDGLMLTNFHVVEGAKAVAVKLKDRSIRRVETVGAYDVDRDLVILKVGTRPMTKARLGDSGRVIVGEPIIVVGNPEGLERTVSNGLISGVRESKISGKLFQISAPISGGSSGGPAFNERGEVIGVVVGYYQDGQNLNFAIPINYAKVLMTSSETHSLASLPRRPKSEQTEKASTVGSLEGAWAGTFADSQMSGQLALNLLHSTEGQVIGTYASSLGGGGKVSGTVSDGVLRFTLTQTVQGCPGTFSGYAVLQSDTLIGKFAGMTCLGEHKNGTFTMTRGAAPITSPPPAATTPKLEPVFEDGSPSEFRGVKTVFVFTDTNPLSLDARENIIKTLSEYHQIVVVNEINKADAVLFFGASSRYGIYGGGIVAKFIPPNRFRTVWQFEDTRTTMLERRPSSNFARGFIKIHKQMNR